MSGGNAITILLPCHSTKFLPDAIKSISTQTLSNDKFIVYLVADRVDTTECEKLFTKYKINYKIIKSKTPGIVEALNLGLSETNSKYIARMDEDDVMDPRRLEYQYKFLSEHRECVAVGGQLRTIDIHNKIINRVSYSKKIKNRAKILMQKSPLAHPAVMMRRSAIEIVGGYRENFAEDWDLWVRLSEVGSLHNLGKIVLNYRIHDSQLSRQKMYILSTAREAISLSYFARKNGIPDQPMDNEDFESWKTKTRIHLFEMSREYRKFALWKNNLEKFELAKELLKQKFNFIKMIYIFIKFPLLITKELIQIISARVICRVFL